MLFNSLSNHSLIDEIKRISADERRLVTRILELLCEVERRLLHAELGYSSLYEFCIKELGYCEGSAHLRISSMRLMKSVSIQEKEKIEKKLEDGDLSLSNLSMIQNFVRREEKANGVKTDVAEKIDLISKVENKTKREAETILINRNPCVAASLKESVKTLQNDQMKITLVVKNSFMEKMKRAKELRAHASASESHAELFEEMLTFYLKHKDPALKAKRNTIEKQKSPGTSRSVQSDRESEVSETCDRSESPASIQTSIQTRSVEAKVKHAVWIRDSGQCTYINEKIKWAATLGLD
jgi:hypothetical protein